MAFLGEKNPRGEIFLGFDSLMGRIASFRFAKRLFLSSKEKREIESHASHVFLLFSSFFL